jgi:hypothetical protein
MNILAGSGPIYKDCAHSRTANAPMTLGTDLEPAVKLRIQNIAQNASGDQFSFS